MEIITISTIIIMTGLITGGIYIKNKIWEFSEDISFKITGRKYVYTK